MWYLIEIVEKYTGVTTCKISESKPSNLQNKEIVSEHPNKLSALKELSEMRCDFYMIEMTKYSSNEIDELVFKFSKEFAKSNA